LLTHLFWDSKLQGQGHNTKKHCQLGSLHSCECWLLVVLGILVIVFETCLVCLCSVAHADVTATSATLTNNLKSIGADEEDVSITYTYSISFVVSLQHLLLAAQLKPIHTIQTLRNKFHNSFLPYFRKCSQA